VLVRVVSLYAWVAGVSSFDKWTRGLSWCLARDVKRGLAGGPCVLGCCLCERIYAN